MSDNDDKKTFLLNIQENGNYIFAYSFYNSNIKLNILNYKLIIVDLYIIIKRIISCLFW